MAAGNDLVLTIHLYSYYKLFKHSGICLTVIQIRMKSKGCLCFFNTESICRFCAFRYACLIGVQREKINVITVTFGDTGKCSLNLHNRWIFTGDQTTFDSCKSIFIFRSQFDLFQPQIFPCRLYLIRHLHSLPDGC